MKVIRIENIKKMYYQSEHQSKEGQQLFYTLQEPLKKDKVSFITIMQEDPQFNMILLTMYDCSEYLYIIQLQYYCITILVKSHHFFFFLSSAAGFYFLACLAFFFSSYSASSASYCFFFFYFYKASCLSSSSSYFSFLAAISESRMHYTSNLQTSGP